MKENFNDRNCVKGGGMALLMDKCLSGICGRSNMSSNKNALCIILVLISVHVRAQAIAMPSASFAKISVQSQLFDQGMDELENDSFEIHGKSFYFARGAVAFLTASCIALAGIALPVASHAEKTNVDALPVAMEEAGLENHRHGKFEFHPDFEFSEDCLEEANSHIVSITECIEPGVYPATP